MEAQCKECKKELNASREELVELQAGHQRETGHRAGWIMSDCRLPQMPWDKGSGEVWVTGPVPEL